MSNKLPARGLRSLGAHRPSRGANCRLAKCQVLIANGRLTLRTLSLQSKAIALF
jgi:hypothetical protein